MTEDSRQRRLSVQNRLQELRTKYGRDLEDETLPAWLDSLEGAVGQQRRGNNQTQPPAGEVRPPTRHAQVVAPPVVPNGVFGMDIP